MREPERRMLVSMAHPDDESFGMAGTIARYASEGVGVYLICATNGDVGMVEPEFMRGFETIAELRRAELDCAVQTLGLERVYAFGYRDSGMRGSPDNRHPDSLFAADLDEVTRRVTEVIRMVRPQVVVTFDPSGGYGHPDHVRMHQATVRAVDAAADPAQYPEQIEVGLEPYRPQKLYYMTFDRHMLRIVVRLLPLFGVDPARMGRNQDLNMYEFAAVDSPIHARIATSRYAHIADQARRCHASQLGGAGGPRRISEAISRLLFGTREPFTRAQPPVNGARVRETDLFEGVRPDRPDQGA